MNKCKGLFIMPAMIIVLVGCASSKSGRHERTNQFDTDGDGYLTPEEFSASALSKAIEFDSLDIDNDGLLSEAELEFHPGRELRERRSGGGKGRRSSELVVDQELPDRPA